MTLDWKSINDSNLSIKGHIDNITRTYFPDKNYLDVSVGGYTMLQLVLKAAARVLTHI